MLYIKYFIQLKKDRAIILIGAVTEFAGDEYLKQEANNVSFIYYLQAQFNLLAFSRVGYTYTPTTNVGPIY